MTQEELQQIWAARIKDYRASGERVSAWCERQGVTQRQLWYWMKKLKRLEQEKSADQPLWLSVHVDEDTTIPSSSLLVTVGSATIEVRAGFEPSLLADVIKTLKTVC
ncbi:IS66 family insertion sequence element accessory protein TnpA [Ferviditalea candida]|uniref:Helix-turn-helix domain-containing protein n=1 Tax=Ferviditalea candida TaxID=3108399 RepID=A0ABU5ZNI0_9BACL|nr:helix-turn-helix domain-containing protein [Paenibacillaceae bacterium T2]